MSLQRGVSYCAHPINDRPIIPQNKFVKKVDMGERNYSFRLTTAHIRSLERLTVEFNMPPYACNVFPVDTGRTVPELRLEIQNKDIVLVTMKKAQECEGYVLRLLNNSSQPAETVVECGGTSISLAFGRYEVKTIIYANQQLIEKDRLMI